MNVAAITIYCNEEYKIHEWLKNYDEYKECISKLIIVDNGSKKESLDVVKKKFPDAIIVEREKNGGVTAAYNSGIKKALEDSKIDAIMLICNDIKISGDSVRKLYQELNYKERVGMVTPVLLEKDSDIIADGGCTISYCLFMKPKHVGEKYSTIEKKNFVVESVTGGMNMGSRKFYEEIGLQNETLFMYSDEIDVGLKAKKKGYKMLMVPSAVAWHQHINLPGRERRLPFSDYLMARNKVYLGREYFGELRAINIFIFIAVRECVRCALAILKRKSLEPSKYALYGAWNGLKGNMEIPAEMKLY